MISQAALKEVADAGGFVILPWHDKMYSDYAEFFAVLRPSWYDEEKKQLDTTGVCYPKNELGYAAFLNDWELTHTTGQEFKVSLRKKK